MLRNTFSYVFSLMLVVADFIAILLSLTLAYVIRVDIDQRPLINDIQGYEFVGLVAILIPIWLLIFAVIGLYKQEIYRQQVRTFLRIIFGVALGMLVIITYDWTRDESIFPARLIPVYGLVLATIMVWLDRALMSRVRKIMFARNYGISNVLIIGNSAMSTELARLLGRTPETGYRISAMASRPSYIPNIIKTKHLNGTKQALAYIRSGQAQIVIQTEQYAPATNQQIIETSQRAHAAYKFVPPEQSLVTNKIDIDLLANVPVVSVYPTPLIGWGRIAKRLFDIFTSIVGLLIALPIFIVVGVIIKLSDPKGPIFYKHSRVSRFGNKIDVYKLRSMYQKYSASSLSDIEIIKSFGRPDLVKEWRANQKLQFDPRVMPIGRFIRKTSIDELPQLWNVLKGELSLIGPRPVTKQELNRYAKSSPLFLSIKPGITGLWQVSGRNQTTYEERIALDLYYVQNWSFVMDLKIIYRTVISMLTAKGQ